MGFYGFEPAIDGGRLCQGEVLGPVIEYVPQSAPGPLPDGENTVRVAAVEYKRVLLMTQDCDLEQDARLRLVVPSSLAERNDVAANPASVPHLLLCPLFEDIRSVVAGGDIAKRAKKNHDARYHAFVSPGVAQTDAGDSEVDGSLLPPELFIDFRRYVSLPTDLVYEAVSTGLVQRLGVVPEMNRLEAAQRFFGYQARIPVP